MVAAVPLVGAAKTVVEGEFTAITAGVVVVTKLAAYSADKAAFFSAAAAAAADSKVPLEVTTEGGEAAPAAPVLRKGYAVAGM